MTNKSVRIVVAAHKAYQMPTDSMYLPLHVGAKGKTDLGYTRDDTGEDHIDGIVLGVEESGRRLHRTGSLSAIFLPEEREKRGLGESYTEVF